MQTDTLTIAFRAKRDSDGEYRIPVVKPHHVATPRTEQGIRHQLFLSAKSDDIAMGWVRNALRFAGIDPYAVSADMPGVTVTPRGNGFMADIRIVMPWTAESMRGH